MRKTNIQKMLEMMLGRGFLLGVLFFAGAYYLFLCEKSDIIMGIIGLVGSIAGSIFNIYKIKKLAKSL